MGAAIVIDNDSFTVQAGISPLEVENVYWDRPMTQLYHCGFDIPTDIQPTLFDGEV